MKHLPSTLGIVVLLFALCRVGFSLGTWHNCTKDSCQPFFVSRECDIVSTCQCGVTTNQSTCSIEPSMVANKTGVSLDTSLGPLNCCMCESNSTFCCDTCQLSTTSIPMEPTATTKILQTTNAPLVEEVILVVVFILDIKQYASSSKQLLGLWFRYAIGNLTNTDNSLTDVTKITFSDGVQPYCGFKVDSINVINSNKNVYANSEKCSSLVINATMRKDSSSSRPFAKTIELIQESVKNGTFFVPLWDASKIKAHILLSATLYNSSYVLHRGPYVFVESPSVSPTKKVAPIHTNLWPLIYSGIGVFSLIALCIIWQCLKQSYLLRKKKYTDINSNRVNSRKRKIQEAMANQEISEKETQRERGQFDMTHNKLQTVDNEALTRRYDWTTPGYLPSMLAPAYAPTELHGQHSPPRLMLDDEDSDNDKKSIGKASVINIDEETDEDLKEILESEDEDDVFKDRTSTRQSYSSRKKSISISNKRKPSTTSKTSSSPRNTSAKSISKIPNPAIGKVRKCSYSGPEGRERTPSPGLGKLKINRVTPVNGDRKPSITSLKPRKKGDSDC